MCHRTESSSLDLKEVDNINVIIESTRDDSIENVKVLKNISFHNDILLSSDTLDYKMIKEKNRSGLIGFSSIKFINCSFSFISIKVIDKKYIFEECDMSNISFLQYQHSGTNRLIIVGGLIGTFHIEKKQFLEKFYINKQDGKNDRITKINTLIIKDTIFEKNFKLHNCVVDRILIEDTDFKENADFYMSEFRRGILEEDSKEKINKDDIGFNAINFESLALFGDTVFHKKLIFKYVTFKGHNHFKSAVLHKGLDLEYTNIQNEINFYGLTILNTSTTSQETCRIIKHQFEKLGNKIEANKYHALELEQKKNTLEAERPRKWLEYIVFKMHSLSSKHSTNWFRPLWLSLLVTIMTVFFVNIELVMDLLTQRLSFKLEYFYNVWNEFFKYLYILNKDEKLVESPFIFLLNKIFLGYLYYQFLISVRKDTRK
ncbi:MAG: hypothetical protein COA39_007840 [Sulfurimonas sp.]|nr:hypothetical protein [Sulfurimonas sp.]